MICSRKVVCLKEAYTMSTRIVNKILEFTTDPASRFASLASRGFYNSLSDEEFIRRKFKYLLGYSPDLKKPNTFNEKMQWLKLNDRKPIYTTIADKDKVKGYVSSIIGKEHIIPTLGVWDHFDDIDFHRLPDKFVLKCTHNSGSNVIVKDKKALDKSYAKKILDNALKINYYYLGREWPYKNINPKIIAESYIDDGSGQVKDYKFFCFNGKVRCFKIDFNRENGHQANYYTPSGRLMKMGEVVCPPDYSKQLAIPSELNNMIEISEQLAQDSFFRRIDLYEIKGNILFGEVTFYPNSGFGKFTDIKWDYKLGE